MRTGMKVKMTLFIVLFLLLVALIIYIMSGSTSSFPGEERQEASQQSIQIEETDLHPSADQPQIQITPVPIVIPQTEPSAGSVQPTAVPVPIPTATPVPTAAPTPIPTPSPQPVGMAAGNGSFRSDSGSLLNIHADWSAAVADENTVTVTVAVYVDHYQLDYSAYKSLIIQLGESSQSLDGESIHYTESAIASTEVGTAHFSVNAARGESVSLPLSVKWSFGGQYGDGYGNKVDIDRIECGGTITVSR